MLFPRILLIAGFVLAAGPVMVSATPAPPPTTAAVAPASSSPSKSGPSSRVESLPPWAAPPDLHPSSAKSDIDQAIAKGAAPANADDVSPLPAEVIAKATARLKGLVARQDQLLAAAGQKDADMDNVKREIQDLIYDYDDFIRVYPTFAPGFVTYGLLLSKVGMRRQAAVVLLKANRLDPDIPIVKNELGNYVAEEGNPIEAANYFISAIRLAPNEPLYHYQLGRLLTEARDDFLKSGQWTAEQIDKTMQEALKRASELDPKSLSYAYYYAYSFYDVANPNWDAALKAWGEIEERVAPGLEKETIRLQAANILIKQKKFDHARVLLGTVTVPELQTQKQKLLDQLAGKPEK